MTLPVQLALFAQIAVSPVVGGCAAPAKVATSVTLPRESKAVCAQPSVVAPWPRLGRETR